MDRAALDSALIAAHEAGDSAALIRLYTTAGEIEEQAGQIDAACFFYTQAFVFALEAGDPAAKALNLKLVSHDREHLLSFPT